MSSVRLATAAELVRGNYNEMIILHIKSPDAFFFVLAINFSIQALSKETSTLSTARQGLAVALGSKMYFAGGFNSSGALNIVDIYDLDTDNWTLSALSQARSDLAAIVVGNKLLLATTHNLFQRVLFRKIAKHYTYALLLARIVNQLDLHQTLTRNNDARLLLLLS